MDIEKRPTLVGDKHIIKKVKAILTAAALHPTFRT